MEKYTKVDNIGKGNFGWAILVSNKKENYKKYVMKIINIKNMKPKQLEDSINEIKILSSLNHPYIISYKESFKKSDNLWIVMDYADGKDLYHKISHNKKINKYFTEEEILDYFTQILLAVEHIHEKKILHRDLKTSNIFLTKNNKVQLGDFGISRVMQGTYDLAKTAIGTPYYLSPEICKEQPYSYKSDIWSLGCVLYELATLNHAFDAQNIKGLILKILKGNFDPIPNFYSKELSNLINKLLKSDHKERPDIKEILAYPIIRNHIKKLDRFVNITKSKYTTPTPRTPNINVNLSKKFDELYEKKMNRNDNKENLVNRKNKNLNCFKKKDSNQSKSINKTKPKVVSKNKLEIKFFNPMKSSKSKPKINVINQDSTSRKSSFLCKKDSKPSVNKSIKSKVSLTKSKKSFILEDKPLKSKWLFEKIPYIKNQDNIFYKIEALRVYLEEKLGLSNFVNIYRSLSDNNKNCDSTIDWKNNKYISMIIQLIFLEKEKYD